MTLATNYCTPTKTYNHVHPTLYLTTPRRAVIPEIARLENSLQHLKLTQDELRSYSDDPELSQILRENEAVMFVPCPCSFKFF